MAWASFMANILYFYLCLFDIIVKLHAMDEIHSMTLFLKKEKRFYM